MAALEQASHRFSCDLVEQSKSHVRFLQTLHLSGITVEKPSAESLRRYSELWLPLVHQQYDNGGELKSTQEKMLIPPADIAWLWHCHRLAPYRYAKYTQKRFFGRVEQDMANISSSKILSVLDADFPFVLQLESDDGKNSNATRTEAFHSVACDNTIKLWTKQFPDEPFFLATNGDGNKQTLTENKLLGGFDVLESCERQAAFLWQVSQVTFHDNEFLRDGVTNYFKFVSLMGKSDRPRFLVPTYQIDLMWHTHILNSIAVYHSDCMDIIKTILEHDDSLTDRTEGGTLDTNFQQTCKLWSDVYGVQYRVEGGMYRGEPPKQFFDPSWVTNHANGHNNEMHPLLPGLTFAHLIGRVGASSFGRDEKLVWMSVDSDEAFVEPAPKSTTRGVNANPIKDGYVFGKGVRGTGYYNLHTRESYQIIFESIEVQEKKNKVHLSVWTICMFSVIFTLCAICETAEIKKRLILLADFKQIVQARMNAAGPTSDLEIPDEVMGRVRARDYNKTHDDSYYYHGSYLTTAAACG
jgi:hypothetical protein